MMTRAGTNTLRGSANYTHWNNQFNSPNLQQKVTFKQDPRQEEAWRVGPLAHRRLHARRSDRHPEARRRAQQGVLLRQLLEVERLGAGPSRRQLDGAGQPEAPRRRFLGPAAAAVGRRGHHAGGPPSVPDLRSADDAARSGCGPAASSAIRSRTTSFRKDRFMNPDGSYKNPLFALYQAMVPAPNQNFLSPTQQPTNNYYRAAEPDQPHNTQGSVRVDYNHSDSIALLLPRQRQQVPRVVAGRLDLRLARSAVPRPARRRARALQLVGDGHLDEGASRAARVIDTQISRQSRPSAGHAQEHGQLHADVGRPAVVPGRVLPGAVRVHPAADEHQLGYQGDGRHRRRRHLGHDLPGAVEPDEHRAGRTPGAAAWTCSGPSAPAATAPGTWARSTTTTPTRARPIPRTCFRRSKSA